MSSLFLNVMTKMTPHYHAAYYGSKILCKQTARYVTSMHGHNFQLCKQWHTAVCVNHSGNITKPQSQTMDL